MAGGYQQTVIVGNLGADPDIRITGSGKTVANVNVAVNTGSGEYEHTEWFRCTAWEKTAEIIGEYTRKGSKVMFVGEMRTDSWEDQETGEKKYRTNLVVRQVLLLDSKPRGGDDDGDRRPSSSGSRIPPTKVGSSSKPQQRRPVAPPMDDDDLPF